MLTILFGVYLFLAVFAAGNLTTLQLQHYNLYPLVGKDIFRNYIEGNNKSALVPSILPAMLLLVISLVLLFFRPSFMSLWEAVVSAVLNILALVSTFKWQRSLQGDMALGGYDDAKVKLLNSTNWIRTVAFVIQAILATAIIVSAVR